MLPTLINFKVNVEWLFQPSLETQVFTGKTVVTGEQIHNLETTLRAPMRDAGTRVHNDWRAAKGDTRL